MRNHFFVLFFLLIPFFSCTKEEAGACETAIKLTASTTMPTIGESFTLITSGERDNDLFYWSGPAYSQTTNSNSVHFNEVKYSQRGWYYCSKSNPECNTTLRDSIFIDVKLSQEQAPCTLTNNFFSSSNLVSDNTLTTITQGMDPTFNGMGVYGGDRYGYPSLRVLFNSYNGNTEPKDGVYITNNSLIFDVTQEYNTVSVSFLYASSFYHCWPNQKLYVSHVNGKLQVSFCDMVFSNGTIKTTCKGKMTVP